MKRVIGIDINRDYISLVQLCRRAGALLLEKAYVRETPRDCSDEESFLKNIQSEMQAIISAEGFDTKARAIVSMPFGKVFFHNYRTEISTDKDIDRLIKFELEDDFPIPFDDLLTDVCSRRDLNEREREFLVAAVSRSQLRDWVRAINETGLNCSAVTPDVCALAALADSKSDASSTVIIYAHDCRMIISACEKGSPIFVRHVGNPGAENKASELNTEITLTLNAISEAGIPGAPRILLYGSDNFVRKISGELAKQTDSEVAVSNPFAGIGVPSGEKADDRLIIALGLALTGLDNQNRMPNFIAADEAGCDEVVKTKRNAIIFAALLLVIAALSVVNLFVELNSLEKENKRLDNEIRAVFAGTFPEEKKIVNELAQANEKYDALEAEYKEVASEILDRTPTLEMLETISETIAPDEKIDVSEVFMNGDSVRLDATGRDFESVDNLVEKFKRVRGFDSVDVGNIDVDPANDRVRFSLSIKAGVNYRG